MTPRPNMTTGKHINAMNGGHSKISFDHQQLIVQEISQTIELTKKMEVEGVGRTDNEFVEKVPGKSGHRPCTTCKPCAQTVDVSLQTYRRRVESCVIPYGRM